MKEFHVTALRQFLRCRRKWYYSFELGLDAAIPPSKQMLTGIYFHRGMRSLFQGMTLDEAAKEMLKEEPGGDVILAEDMMRYYWQVEGENDKQLKVLQVELPLTCQHKDFLLKGTMDLVYEDSNGRVVVRDYKTVESVKLDPNYIRLDFQFGTYSWMVADRYERPVELEVVYVRRAVPPGFGSCPAETKSGAKSKRSVDPQDYIRKQRWYFSPDQLAKLKERTLTLLDEVDAERSWPRSDIQVGVGSCPSCPHFTLCGHELLYGPASKEDLDMLYPKLNEEKSDELHATAGY